jgi:1A family penicillin-binding protein
MLTTSSLYQALVTGLPNAGALNTHTSASTTKIYDRHGHLLYEIFDPRTGARTRLSLDDIPLTLRQATVAIEDATFYDNPGVEPRAILRAAFQNAQAGEIVSGGSTLTQQVTRLVLLSPKERGQRTLTRKLREAILALWLARTWDKATILETYLNEVYYGELAYGVEAAARVYFGAHARDLDLAQCALLAGLPQAPAVYDPLVNLEAARGRQQIVLQAMVRHGYISQSEADLACAEPLHFVGHSDVLVAPHFVSYVRGQLETTLGTEALLSGGWAVTTTLDLDLQRLAQETIAHHRERLALQGATDAALVALNPQSGDILALVGSADYDDDAIAGAVNVAIAPRQPGSAMKPILYAAALAQGWTPANVVYDVRTALTLDDGAYVPANYDNVFHGPVTLRDALANSYNLPAVLLQREVGTETLLSLAHDLGLTSLPDDADRFGLSLALGSGEVTPLELAAAYAAFADGGAWHAPHAILSATHASLHFPLSTLHSPSPTSHSPLSPHVAFLITDILADNTARTPTFGPDSPLRLSRPAAVKTGTTSDWRDAWTVGYTPDLVVGVWVGNADGSPMTRVSGATGAAPIWHDFMEAALRDRPGRDFARPEGLTRRAICPLSGQLAGPHCPHPRLEWFIPGTEPAGLCDQHVAMALDRHTGRPAADGTRAAQTITRTVWVPPPELKEWAREQGIAHWELEDGRNGTLEEASYPSPDLPTLNLVSPDPYAVLVLSPHVPGEYQRLEVKAEFYSAVSPTWVELYADDELLARVYKAPYRALWPLEEGEHTFYAVALTAGGQRIESQTVGVRVDSP